MLRVQPTIACASPPQELKRLFAQEGPTLLTYHGTKPCQQLHTKAANSFLFWLPLRLAVKVQSYIDFWYRTSDSTHHLLWGSTQSQYHLPEVLHFHASYKSKHVLPISFCPPNLWTYYLGSTSTLPKILFLPAASYIFWLAMKYRGYF